MGKSSGSKMQVVDYLASVHLGVCWGPVDAITGIYVNKKTAWEGNISTQGDIPINQPVLFGGDKQEGGLVGSVRVLPGDMLQKLPEWIAKKFGRTVDNMPGFRGLTSLFFSASSATTSSTMGFWWSTNNPNLAQNIDVRVRRIPTGLDSTLARIPEILNSGYAVAVGNALSDTVNNVVTAINGTSQYFRASASGNKVTVSSKRSDLHWTTGVGDGSSGTATSIGGTTYFSISGMSWNGSTWYCTLTVNANPITNQSFWIGPETFVFQSSEGDYANPAHIIYDVFTNDDWGMGYTSDLIDAESFLYAAQVLHSESLGLSVVWVNQAKIEDFINEILNHIQGLIFVSTRTGLLTLKLLRNDYDPASLRVINPDNAVMTNFQRRMLTETVNEIVVSWTNPLNEQAESVVAQDLGNIAAQGGIVSDSRNYYGVRNSTLARTLAAREVRSSAALLRTMEVQVDRSGWSILPGDCVMVNWPENELSGVVMRVGVVDYGKTDDPMIKLSLTEDIFALDQPTIRLSGDSSWVDPSSSPVDLSPVQIFTLPYFFAVGAQLQSSAISLSYPEVLACVFGAKPAADVSRFTLWGDVVSTTGAITKGDLGQKNCMPAATLPAALPAEASSLIATAIFTIGDPPDVGSMLMIGGGDTAQELVLVTAVGSSYYTVKRGLLDTVPRQWSTGTHVWHIVDGAKVVDESALRAVGETVAYKLLTITSKGILDVAAATEHSATMTGRPHLPLRPANVKINGVGFGSFDASTATNLVITWATRNRKMEDTQVFGWTDGPVTPEYQQETVVTVVDDATGATVYEQGGLWTENSLTLPKTYFAKYSSVTIKVWSRLGDLASLQAYTLQVTGLPANGSADPPPDPPVVTDPVSPLTAPGVNAFTVTGDAITGSGGDKQPAIIVAGASDNSSATALLIRYRQHGSTTWTTISAIAIGSSAISTTVTGLAASTSYDVQVAYQGTVDGSQVLSNWTTPSTSPVTTGASVSTPTMPMIYAPSVFYPGVPADSAIFLMHAVVEPCTIAANFSGAKGGAGTAAGATTVITVYKALAASPTTFASVGTITFAAGSRTPTFATSGAVSFAIGDVLKITGPAAPDATLADIFFTIPLLRTA